jgi:hypothetical protein
MDRQRNEEARARYISVNVVMVPRRKDLPLYGKFSANCLYSTLT